MDTSPLKQQLHQYIETADEAVLNAMFLMLKESISDDEDDVDDEEEEN